MTSELSSRERTILFSLCTEYVASGMPVASRSIAKKHGYDLSPATIRNVMADLEEAGYLAQPHTSAGRVPTEQGLRAFIDALSALPKFSGRDAARVRRRFAEIYRQAHRPEGEVLREAGRALSELAGAAAVVARRRGSARKLSQLRFIRTGPHRLLAVLVLADGTVENRYVTVEPRLGDQDLERVHNLLEELVKGSTLETLRHSLAQRLADDRGKLDALQRKALELGRRALGAEAGAEPAQLVIEGQARLMDLPEYAEPERLRALVRALEDRETLLALLDKTLEARAVSVYLGSETGEPQLSLVVAPYGSAEQPYGTVGVLGPARMDYARVVPLVGATAAAMSEALDDEEP